MKYFRNKTWSETTREERLFCAELFFEIRKNPIPFLELIGKENKDYEVAFESCFYRDVLKAYGISIKDKGIDLPPKRTFDLALFAEDEIVIIEAKAKQGFDSEQLESFEADFNNIWKLFDIIGENVPKIEIIALCSSRYKPKNATLINFVKTITWKELIDVYPNGKEMFLRADEIYND